jgi:hypothetical protein
VWETVDPEGRRVVLEQGRWQHILETHDELDVEPDVILEAVAEPDRRVHGREPGEEWFYLGGFGPTRWIKVVVHFKGDRGLIATAFPRRTFP